jgi:catechol 2,3-dioxygenase-like lactoylglutathione lyase family enzyme
LNKKPQVFHPSSNHLQIGFSFLKNLRHLRNLRLQMNITVEHIAIPAANPVELKKWYERVLGAREIFSNGENPPTCLISLGDVWLEIYQADAPLAERGNNKLAGFRHLALRVPSLAAAKSELEARGVKFAGEIRPAAGGGKVLFFADGEGNLLHLVERAANSPLLK